LVTAPAHPPVGWPRQLARHATHRVHTDAGSNPELARLERYADKCAWRDRRKLEAWKSNPFNPSAHTARAYGSLRGGTMFGTKATSAVTHNDFAAYSRPRSAASRPASAISAAYRARPSSALSRSSRARGGVGQSSTSAAAPWSNTTFLESLSQSKAMVSLDLSGNGASVSFQGFRDDRGADASSGKTDHIPWGAASRVGEVLRACPLLQRIPGDALRQLATGCVQLTLDAGAVVCAEGQRGGCAYVLAQGRLALQRLDAGGGGGARQRAVGELDTTGDCVGELALLLGWPHPLTAVCASPVELVKVPCSALQNIIRAWPGVAALLAESVVEQRRSEVPRSLRLCGTARLQRQSECTVGTWVGATVGGGGDGGAAAPARTPAPGCSALMRKLGRAGSWRAG